VAGNDRGFLQVPNGPQVQPNNNRSRSPSASRRSSGVDDTPTPKISLNFTSELAAEINDRLSRESSADKLQRAEACKKASVDEPHSVHYRHDNDDDGDDDVTVDTTSTCRVSDNFLGTEQYHALNPTPVTAIERRHSTVKEEESVVDTTPFCRVSDSLRAVHDCPPATAGKKKSSHSGHNRGAKKSEPVGTDSGSEVSDEGYRSLGLVASPPANVKNAQKFNGKLIFLYICTCIYIYIY